MSTDDGVEYSVRKNGQRTYESDVRKIEFMEVDTHTRSIDDFTGIDNLLNELYEYYNVFGARQITMRYNGGELEDLGHASMSIGDLISVDGTLYQVQGIGFKKLEFTATKRIVIE